MVPTITRIPASPRSVRSSRSNRGTRLAVAFGKPKRPQTTQPTITKSSTSRPGSSRRAASPSTGLDSDSSRGKLLTASLAGAGGPE